MEIKANELRINNKVLFDGEIDTITQITILGDGFCSKKGYFNLKDNLIMPILIDENILINSGFKKFNNEIYLYDGYFDLSIKFYKNGRVDSFFCGVKEYKMNKETMFIKYFHELQNLYFFLTKNELIINL